MSHAIVFPGQGSQTVGMLAEMAQHSEIVTDTFGQAGDALGYNLWELVNSGPKESLDQTAITQPAILAASVALWRIWQTQFSGQATVMAGHSLGEYSALVCAGGLEFSDAIRLVETRGNLMQHAVPAGEGAMAVVLGLDDDAVVKVCAEVADGSVVEAVNFNSPGQVVIAGHTAAVERASAAAKEAGARLVQTLPVSVPAHSSLMRHASEQFAERLMQVTMGEMHPVVFQNVGIDQVGDTREALVQQLYSPVPWTKIVQTMSALGVTQLVECGPGKVLCGLTRRIDKSLKAYPIHTPDTMASAVTALSGNA